MNYEILKYDMKRQLDLFSNILFINNILISLDLLLIHIVVWFFLIMIKRQKKEHKDDANWTLGAKKVVVVLVFPKNEIKTNKNRSLRCFKGVDKRVCHRGIYFGSIATLDFVSTLFSKLWIQVDFGLWIFMHESFLR